MGNSRLDMVFRTTDDRDIYIEVKSVTLNLNGQARFPDAPTQRGEKHLRELIRLRHEGHRAAILLREVDGLSYREVAAATGVSIGTVMSRLFHARRKLRRILEGADQWES